MAKIAHPVNKSFEDCLKLTNTIFLFFIQDVDYSGPILFINLLFEQIILLF